MSKNKKDKQISIRIPHAGNDFKGRSSELKSLRDAFLEKGTRALGIYGESGAGKTSLAVKFALSMPEQYEYVYSFDCRGGIRAEEVLFRLCQFIDYHGQGNFQNIILSPIPMNLKLEFIANILKNMKLLLIFDDMDTMLKPLHGQISVGDTQMRDTLGELINLCDKGIKFIFTSTRSFDLPLEHIDHLQLMPEGDKTYITEDSVRSDYDALSQKAREAIHKCAAFEKSVTLAHMALDDEAIIQELIKTPLVGTFTLGQDVMGSLHSMAREHIKSTLSRDEWKAQLLSAATYRQQYALEHGVIWHSIYAHDLYVEAMRYDKAAEVAAGLTDALLGWGQTDLAYDLNRTTAEFSEGEHKAQALYTLGIVELGRSSYDDSLAHLNESMSLFEADGNKAGYSDALVQIATVHNNRAKTDDAMGMYEDALKIKEELEDKDAIAMILSRLGQIYQDKAEVDKALDVFNRSALMASEASNHDTEMMALEKLGGMYSSQGDTDKAIEAYERELDLLTDKKEPNSLTRAYNRLGGLYFRKGDANKALELLKKSLKYTEITKDKELAAINLLEIGRVYTETRQYKPAISNTAIALALFDASSSESKSTAIELLTHIEKEMGKDEFEKLNNEVMREFRDKGMG